MNVLPTHGKASYARVRHDPRLPSGNGTSVTTISGLADQGFELSAPHTDAIYFTKGDVLIVVSFSTRSSPPKGAALTLAHIAAGRL